MSVAAFLLSRAARLPRRRHRVTVTRGLRIAMRDGVGLEAELYQPRRAGKHPTLLIRVPYGLRGFSTGAEIYAGHGYNVLIEACRGTAGSEGEFDPLSHERDDGLDTLAWITAQPWFDGRLGTTGASYLGYAQWAICDALPKQSAIAVKVSSAEFRSVVFPGGAFAFGLWLGWIQVIELLKSGSLRTIARRIGRGWIEQRTLVASMQLPLIEADRRATGHDVPFWKRWLTSAIGNAPFWEPLDHTHRLGPRTPPTSFVSGWYDFMIDQLLRDYEALADAGGKPQLTIGPWFHVSPELQYEGIRDTLAWMNAKLLGNASGLRTQPVRIHVGGSDKWLDLEAYPPGQPDIAIWNLHGGGTLSQRAADASPPDRYRYDPADPTPNVGGAMFAFTGAGPVPQAPLEARADVLAFTSGPLLADYTIIGSVRAVIHVRADIDTADLFVKLCDVDDDGVSINICDGIIRRSAADGFGAGRIVRLNFKLHATAHCFRRNHRIRVLVASGAHPRFARNTGTDEPFGTATALKAASIEIFHDPEYPSAVHLPVYDL